jgi:hypothetical protein
MSMKNFNETIGNRSRYLPACSAGPQGSHIWIADISLKTVQV